MIVRCLLTPSIQAGITAVQINEDSINQGQRDDSLSGGFGTVGDRNQGLDTAGKSSADGTSRVVFIETECDTHSPSSWTQTLTCIAIGGRPQHGTGSELHRAAADAKQLVMAMPRT